MSKEEYLKQLEKYLKKLPRQDYEDAMEYFTEYFEDAGEEGEQALMEELGTPKEAASELLHQLLDKKVEEQKQGESDPKQKRKKGHLIWIALLVICAAPIGAPLLLCFLIVLLCILLCAGIVAGCVLLAGVVFFLAGGKLFLRGFLAIPYSISGFALTTGSGLFLIGIAIFAAVLSVYCCKWLGTFFVWVSRKLAAKRRGGEPG